MAHPFTIVGELRLPSALLESHDMEAIERLLHAAGVFPGQAQDRRWRMDHERPGGYVLSYTVALAPEEA